MIALLVLYRIQLLFTYDEKISITYFKQHCHRCVCFCTNSIDIPFIIFCNQNKLHQCNAWFGNVRHGTNAQPYRL